MSDVVVLPLRRLAQRGGLFCDGDWIESPYITDAGVRLIQTGNVGLGAYKEQGFRFISEATFLALNCTEVHPGDLLVCRLAEPVGRSCIAPDLGQRMITSVDVAILRPSPLVADVRYLNYYLSSSAYLNFVDSIARGGTRQRVSRDQLGMVPVRIPRLGHQRAIADYLDVETSRIDALIEKKRQMVELLEERLSVLTDDVIWRDDPWTGPLMYRTNPSRPIMYGIVLPGPDVPEGVPIVKGGDVAAGRLSPELLNRTTREIEAPYARARLAKDDLVFAIRGGIGDVDIVPSELTGANITQDVARVAPARGVSPLWLRFVLRAPSVRRQCAARTTGATIKGLNIWELKRVRVPMGDSSRQDRDLAVLIAAEARTERQMSLLSRQIDLLVEHRQVLITAAVTGQLEVPGVAA